MAQWKERWLLLQRTGFLVPSTVATHKLPVTPVLGDPMPSAVGTAHTVCFHTGKIPIHIKYFLKLTLHFLISKLKAETQWGGVGRGRNENLWGA